MIGNSQKEGLIEKSIKEIFKKIQDMREEKVVQVKVSYVEIYNEKIRDLLVAKEKREFCCLRDDPSKGVTIAGAKIITVYDT